jgi:hypothetical protein
MHHHAHAMTIGIKILAAACAASVFLGLAAGWKLKPSPPPPAPRVEIRTRELTDEEKSKLVRTVTVEVQGPERVVQGPTHIIERWRTIQVVTSTAGTWDCRAEVEHEREVWVDALTTDTGPATSTTETSVSTSSTARRDVQREKEVVPPPPVPLPRWSISGGAALDKDLSPRPVVGLGVRLLGPVWVEASVAPTKPEATAGFRVTF